MRPRGTVAPAARIAGEPDDVDRPLCLDQHALDHDRKDDRFRRIRIGFGVAYGSDKERVREAALAAAQAVEGIVIDDLHPAMVWLMGFGGSSLDFELVAWVGPTAIGRPGYTKASFLWQLETELTKRGIEIPFPQRDVHIRTGVSPLHVVQEGTSDEKAPATAPRAR